MTAAHEDGIADALADIREAAWQLGPLLRALHSRVMPEPIAAHRLVPLLERLPGVRTSELARGRGVTLSTVSRQVDQLVQEGWVRAETDPDDQRAHRLYVTDAGRARLDHIRRELSAYCGARIEPGDVARLTDAATALRAAVDVLRRIDDAAPTPAPCGTGDVPDPVPAPSGSADGTDAVPAGGPGDGAGAAQSVPAAGDDGDGAPSREPQLTG
ncbi:MAG TPA: MarR family transcriptional regulator [Actinocatenispora sp.]